MVSTKKKLFYSVIFTYVEFVLGLLVTILIARTLGPSDYGLFSYWMRIAAILVIIINAGVSTGVLRFIAEYTANSDDHIRSLGYKVYAYYSRIQIVKIALVLGVFFGVIQEVFGLVVEQQYTLLLLIITVAVALKSYYMFCVGALKGLERFDLLAKISFLALPFNLFLVIVGVYLEASLEFFVWVYLAVSALFLLLALAFIYPLFRKHSPVSLVNDFHARSKNYVRVVTFSTVIGALLFGYLEVFYLKTYASIEEVGFYNLAYMVANAAIALVPGVYNAILMPRVVKHVSNSQSGDGSPVFVFSIVRHMLMLHLAVSFPAALYAEELVSVLFGEQYIDAAWVMVGLLMANLAKAVIDPTNAFLVSHDKQGRLLSLYAVTLGFSCFSAWALVANFGLLGAMCSYALTLSVLTVGQLILVRIELGMFALVNQIIKVFVAAILSILIVTIVIRTPWDIFNVIVGSGIYLILFVSLLWAIKGLTAEELSELRKIRSFFLMGR